MSSGWRTEALATHLEMPELNRKAFKVTIGTKVEKRTSAGVSYDDFGEIVYREDEFIVGSVSARIRQEWYDVMHIQIESRHQGYSLQLIQYLKDNKLILHEKDIGLLFYFIFNFTILPERIINGSRLEWIDCRPFLHHLQSNENCLVKRLSYRQCQWFRDMAAKFLSRMSLMNNHLW